MDSSLESALIRDEATYISINKTNVEFTCKCGKNHTKAKQAIIKTSGAFCKSCTSRNTSIKRIRNKIAVNNALLEKGPAN
jgi:Zn finger protein HypA/HybF involved in hydrogenase expression